MDFRANKKQTKKQDSKRVVFCGIFGLALFFLVFGGVAAGAILRTHIYEAAGATLSETDKAAILEAAGIEETVVDVAVLSTLAAPDADYGEEVETTPRDLEFIPLPVDMEESDQYIVFQICRDNNVAFSLVMAIIGKETEFDGSARSATGDSGYMQINDCNLEEMKRRGFVDMYDISDNVGAGVSMLRELFDKYGDSEPHKVLMAYNMGERGAGELWAAGIESSEYSREVLEREAEYSAYIDGK